MNTDASSSTGRSAPNQKQPIGYTKGILQLGRVWRIKRYSGNDVLCRAGTNSNVQPTVSLRFRLTLYCLVQARLSVKRQVVFYYILSSGQESAVRCAQRSKTLYDSAGSCKST